MSTTRRRPGSYTKGQIKDEVFVEAYLSNGGDATAAARAAGKKGTQKTLHEAGCRLLKRVRAAGLIQERVDQVTGIMRADEVLRHLSELADPTKNTMEHFVTLTDGMDARLAAIDARMAALEKNGKASPADLEKLQAEMVALRASLNRGWVYDIAKGFKAGKAHLLRELSIRENGHIAVKMESRFEALQELNRVYMDRPPTGDEDRIRAVRARVLVILMDPEQRRQAQEIALKVLPAAARLVEEKRG